MFGFVESYKIIMTKVEERIKRHLAIPQASFSADISQSSADVPGMEPDS
jgi:hypothetical protein